MIITNEPKKLNNRNLTLFTFDFESTTTEPVTPYILSISKFGKIEKGEFVKSDIDTKLIYKFSNFREILNYYIVTYNNPVFYAHNLTYDISIILWLLKFDKHVKISSQLIVPLSNKFMQLVIETEKGEIIFRDSFIKFGAPLAKILKEYTTREKGETPLFEKSSDIKITNDIIKYVINDSEGLAEALQKRLTNNIKLTTSGDALANYIKILRNENNINFGDYFKIIKSKANKKLREYYKGGLAIVNHKYRNKVMKNIIQIDVNSMYPFQLYSKPMPYGLPIYQRGKVKLDKFYNVGVQKFIVDELEIKPNCVPFASSTRFNYYGSKDYISNLSSDVDSEEDRTFYLTLPELELFLKCYNVTNIRYIEGYVFKSSTNMFKKYIDYYMNIKKHEKGSKRDLAKLMLNSLYGKFGQNTEKSVRSFYFDEIKKQLRFKTIETIETKPIYLPVAIFTTSYARIQLIETILKLGVKNFIYSDTDSIHFLKNKETDEILKKLDIDDSRLGAWGIKDSYKKGLYIRAKRYCIENSSGELDISCAGIKKISLKEKIKKVEDFKEGTKIESFIFRQCIGGMASTKRVITV